MTSTLTSISGGQREGGGKIGCKLRTPLMLVLLLGEV